MNISKWDKKSGNDFLGSARFDVNLLPDFAETQLSIELDTQGSLDVKVVYTPGKEFGSVMRLCRNTKTPYTDTSFPATTSSLYRARRFLILKGVEEKEVVWMRPKDFCARAKEGLPELFFEGIEPADITQQLVGDCYFLGALAVLATQPRLVRRLFSPSEYCEYGVYQLKFFWNKNWESVVIDDWLPMRVSDHNSAGVNTLVS
jgi:hypothetical protein